MDLLAAAGLALDMLGAYGTQVRRGDPASMSRPMIVLGVLCVVIAIGRYIVAPL